MLWGKGIHHTFVEGAGSVGGDLFDHTLEGNILRGMRFLLNLILFRNLILLKAFFNCIRGVPILEIRGERKSGDILLQSRQERWTILGYVFPWFAQPV
jgi:hypothetical protein